MDRRVAQPESLMLPRADDLMQIMSRPAPVIAHPAWLSARDKILDLVHARCHLIALLGPAGSGKTTLLRELAETLRRTNPIIFFSEFSDNSCEFPPDGIVLVDEAERLSHTSFAMLALKAATTVILTALPSFYGRFMEFRDGGVVPLPLLTDQEAMAFLGEWMAQFGLPLDCVTPDAWERLIAHCQGVPRLLASLLKLALFVGADEASPRIMLKHMETAIAVQGGGAETNLAEVAGLSAEDAHHDADDEISARPRSDLDIPLLESAALTYEAADTSRVGGAPGDEVPEEKRKPGRGRRIVGWITTGAVCLAAIALVLWWNRQSLLNNRILLAQNTSIEASDSSVAKVGPAPGSSVPTVRAKPETAQASNATLPANASPIAASAVPSSEPATTAPTPAVQTQASPAEGGAATTPRIPASASGSSVEAKASPVTAPAATTGNPIPPPLPAPAPAPAGPPTAQTSSRGQTPTASGPVPAIAPTGALTGAAAEARLPSGASVRIVVTYASGDEAALQRSLDVSRILRASGFTVLDPFPLPPKRAKKGIRYYFVQDEGVADTIMHRLGHDYGAATLARVSVIDGLPRPGTIEVDVPRE